MGKGKVIHYDREEFNSLFHHFLYSSCSLGEKYL